MNKSKMIIPLFILLIFVMGASAVSANDINDVTIDDSAMATQDMGISSNNVRTANEYTIQAGSNSSTIQDTINQMQSGDVLNFEAGTYDDICIYINKNITVNGNGAILNGYSSPGENNTNIPEIIRNTTLDGGYGISQFATVYIINTENTNLTGLTISGLTSKYSDCVVYATNNANLKIQNNTILGSSWGIYLNICPDTKVLDNIVKNQATTGILNFGSARSLIKNNTVINAKNHGIDVRHGSGPNVVVDNNTVIGSAEGIYIMHSKFQTVTNNNVINSTLAGITFYGAGESKAENNTITGGRTGFLLGGSFYNITIGENTYKLASLPYPPTFVYYIGMAQSPYQTPQDAIGKYSDNSTYDPAYESEISIPAEKDISVDLEQLTKPTGTTYQVMSGFTNEQIQNILNSMNDGDTVIFEKAVYENICLYTDKNIKIIGNGATLRGFNTANNANVPDKVKKPTTEGGYGVVQVSVLYILNNSNVVISGLNIEGQCAGYDVNTVGATTNEYKTVDIFAQESANITILNCNVSGNSWGIFLNYCPNAYVINNNVEDVYTTGIMNFGSPNSVIVNNTVTNAVNHGIDVRHGSGPNVIVTGNKISGAKEGIYLMHSKGHQVYNNEISNCQMSAITAYGSGNEYIYNNTIKACRAAFILSGGYYNVTIGPNNYALTQLPYPPTFPYYIIFADSQYQSASSVSGEYSDIKFTPKAVIITQDTTVTRNDGGNVSATLKNNMGQNIADEELVFTIDGVEKSAITNSLGVATVPVGNLKPGNYTVRVSFKGNEELAPHYEEFKLEVLSSGIELISNDVVKYYKNGTQYTVTVLDAGGNPIAGQSVALTLNSSTWKNPVTYYKVTDANGVATLPIGLSVGKYNIVATLDGESVENTITVLPMTYSLNAEDLYMTFKDGSKYEVTLVDADNNPVADKTVAVTLNSPNWKKPVTYNRVTDANGVASLPIGLSVGTYEVTAAYGEESVTTTINVLKSSYKIETGDVVKYFKNGTQYTVTVKDLNGNPVAGKTVAVTLNSPNWKKPVTYNIVTDANGVATLAIGLSAGSYTVSANVDGNIAENSITVLPVLTTEDLTKAENQKASLYAKLVDSQGNPAAGKTVTFKVNTVSYNKTTNADGIAELPIGLCAGKWTIIVSDPTTGSTATSTVTVTKAKA